MSENIPVEENIKNSIFEDSGHMNPAYDKFDKYVKMLFKGFWTPARYDKGIRKMDVPQINNEFTEIERSATIRSIVPVLLVEDKVKLYWPTVHNDFPQTIIGDVGSLIDMTETVHRRSYHALAQYLNIKLSDYTQEPVIKGRIDYLQKHLEKDPKIIGDKRKLKKLVLFSSLVERCSLFTQFYILMSFAKNNRGLKTISALQQTSATEELLHYTFGLDLINTVKQEKPQLWDEYLVDLVSKNIQDAYKAELALIDWIFEKGVPPHLTKEEVVNFLNYNFHIVATDLQLPLKFEYDKELYKEKSAWMLLNCGVPAEPDFFVTAVGGYSSEDENEEDVLNEIFGN